ncbi:MAG: dioxygenase, partial [Pseudolabrys sp.]
MRRPRERYMSSSTSQWLTRREAIMIIQRQEDVTKVVTEAFKNTQPPRLREILVSLVTHLHAFARDVHLTEEEFEKAVQYVV